MLHLLFAYFLMLNDGYYYSEVHDVAIRHILEFYSFTKVSWKHEKVFWRHNFTELSVQ